MKLISALHIALLGVAAFSFTGCVTPPDSGHHPRWQHVKELPAAKPPRGKVVTTEDGSVVTLPNGKKFVSKLSASKTALTFPNGQVFSAETAKGGFQPPYVNANESLVASLIIPSTQSGDLHLFIVGKNGKYRELIDVNGKIGNVLKQAKAPFGADALRIQGLKGCTLSLASVDYGAHRGEADLFDLRVATDGTLSLCD